MSSLQIILLIIAIGIFTIFFKQLFSGNYPKRGEDFEAKEDSLKEIDINIFSNKDKKAQENSKDTKSRVQELFDIAQKALEDGNNIEAKKALQSLLIIEPNNTDAMRMLAVAYMNMNNYTKAKEVLNNLLQIDANDDLAYTLLANAEHKLGEDENALIHHKKAIELDSTYAKHYYDYANTLYDLGRFDEAKANYQKAYSLDNSLKEAKEMLERIG